MKSLFICLAMCLVINSTIFSQNKSLGVGTPSPNPNAALHVESPTNNQGIIIPRLSSAQRSAFTAALGAGDTGLIVFDTDLRALAIWNGGAWDIGSKVGQPISINNAAASGNAGTFSVSNAANNDVAINATTLGTGHAAYIEVNNPTNANAALFVGTNGSGNAITANGTIQASAFVGDGSALINMVADSLKANVVKSINIQDGSIVDIDISNTATIAGTKINPDFGAQNMATTGTVAASAFIGDGSSLTNMVSDSLAANTVKSINIQDGSIANIDISPTASISGTKINSNFGSQNIITTDTVSASRFVGDGSLLTNLPFQSILPLTDTLSNTDMLNDFDALNITYTGDSSRTLLSLNYTNATSTAVSNLFRLNHAGQGAAFVLNQTSTLGTGSIFSLTNAANPQQAVRGTTNGTGNAIQGQINNGASTANAIQGSTNGTGSGVRGQNTGAGNGFAGSFSNTNAANTFPAIQASTAGTGTGVRVIQSGTSPGGGMDVYMQNTSSTAVGFAVDQQGLGVAGNFNINNSGNATDALQAGTNGFGNAVSAFTSGTGRAGWFHVSNVLNTSPGITLLQQGTGNGLEISLDNPLNSNTALNINHSGTGNAITANAPIQATQFIGDGSLLTNLPGGGSGDLLSTNNLSELTNTAAARTNLGLGVLAELNNIGSPEISDQSITDADINNTAAIQGIKINPDFGTQNIATTGSITAGSFVGDGSLLSGLPAGFVLPYSNSTNNSGSLFSLTNTNTSTGSVALFENTNGTNTGNALTANTASNGGGLALSVNASGVSTAMQINATNAGNTLPALNILHSGTGNAITANRPIQATQFIGDGSALTGISGLTLPYTQSTASASIGFEVITSGTNNAARFENTNAANGNPTLRVASNGNAQTLSVSTSGTGNAAYFVNTNTGSTAAALHSETISQAPAVRGVHSGTFGNAGEFSTTNASNSADVLRASTANTNTAATFFSAGKSIDAYTTGTSNFAMTLSTSNAANSFPTLDLTNNGSGSGIRILNNNATSSNSGVESIYSGTGAGISSVTTTGSSAILGTNNGSGSAIRGENGGSGYAGEFVGSNNSSTIFSTNSNTGPAGQFFVTNPTSNAAGVIGETGGTGYGVWGLTQTGSAAVQGTLVTGGTGFAVNGRNQSDFGSAAEFINQSPLNPNYAMRALTLGEGSAANIEISNPANSTNALQVETNGTGAAISANQSNNGAAIKMIAGGLNVTSLYIPTYPAGGTINTRAVAYMVANGGSYNFGFTLNEGDLFLVKNEDSVTSITLGLATIPPNTGKILVYVNSSLREF